MLKIWSNEKYLRSKNDVRPILMPFFEHGIDNSPDKGRFDKWILEGKNIFQLSSLEESNFVIYPQDPTIDPNGFLDFQNITNNKPLIVFFNSDSEQKINMRSNSYLFRTSAQKNKSLVNEFGLPAWSSECGKFSERIWEQIPTIGFCGQDRTPKIRSIGLDILKSSNLIKTNFIRKSEFWGGWFSKGMKIDHGNLLRKEFISNMENSDYVFCIRGGGNFSYRLYETLSAGRIPFLIDTNCLLPCCLYLNESYELFPRAENLQNIQNILLNFHQTHKDDFGELQHKIRKFWENNLSPTGFFKYVERKMRGIINE